jgi:hypothetical protein
VAGEEGEPGRESAEDDERSQESQESGEGEEGGEGMDGGGEAQQRQQQQQQWGAGPSASAPQLDRSRGGGSAGSVRPVSSVGSILLSPYTQVRGGEGGWRALN